MTSRGSPAVLLPHHAEITLAAVQFDDQRLIDRQSATNYGGFAYQGVTDEP